MQQRVQQTRLNAISAKILHQKKKNSYERLNKIFLGLTLIVPLVFIIAQFITKATPYEPLVNYISFGLSILLMSLSILALILKVNDKITVHKMGIKNNIFVTNECIRIVDLPENEQEWFFRYVSEIDHSDADVFAGISAEEKRETYREALKELEPGNHTIKCPMCNSSPWNYKKGDCQLCGNTITK